MLLFFYAALATKIVARRVAAMWRPSG